MFVAVSVDIAAFIQSALESQKMDQSSIKEVVFYTVYAVNSIYVHAPTFISRASHYVFSVAWRNICVSK